MSKIDFSGWSNDEIIAFAGDIDGADETFNSFLKTWDGSGDISEAYQNHMKKASSATSKFGATLKSVAANIAIMAIINLVIKGATALWDNYNVTVEETQEKIDDLTSSIETLQKEFDELSSREPETLSKSEQARLDYLDTRIAREKELLKVQQARLAQELVGDGFTDHFDKDNYNTKIDKEEGNSWWQNALSFIGVPIDGLKSIKELKEILFNDSSEDIDILGVNTQNTIDSYKDVEMEILTLQKRIEYFGESAKDYQKWVNKLAKLEEKQSIKTSSMQDHRNQWVLKASEYENAVYELNEIINNTSLSSETRNDAQKAKDWYDEQLAIAQNYINDLDAILTSPVEAIKSIDERLINVSKEQLEDANFTDEELALLVKAEFDYDATVEDLRALLEELKPDAEVDVSIDYSSLTEQYESTSDSAKSLRSSITSLTKAFDEQNASNSISVDTMLDLVENGYATAISYDEATKSYVLNKDAILDLLRAKIEEQKITIQRTQGELINALNAEIDGLKRTTEGYYDLLEAKKLNLTTDQLLAMEQYNNLEAQRKALEDVYANWDKVVDGTYGSSSSAKDLAQATKDYIESYMDLQKKSLEKGVIDYKSYCNNVSSMLKKMYDDGKISAKDYHSYTKEQLDVQKSIYDKAVSGMVYVLDKEIESLEKDKETIEDNYQAKIDAIQSEIDALEEVNQKRQEQMELEKAQYELERAQNQRSKKVFNGTEFVYESDQNAVRDAQDTLADQKHKLTISQLENKIESLERAMESEIDTIDKEIEKYEEYKEQIEDVTDAYENAENVRYALAVTGLNNESEILQCRIDVLEGFKEDYLAIQQAIVDAAWNSANEQLEANALLDGQNNDEINEQPVDTNKSATPIVTSTINPNDQPIKDKIHGTSGTHQEVALFSDTSSVVGNTVDSISKETFVEAEDAKIVIKGGGFQHTMAQLQYEGIYHNGIESGVVGDNPTSKQKTEILKRASTGLLSDEVPAILQKGEVVLTKVQQSNLVANLLNNPLTPNYENLVKVNTPDFSKLALKNNMQQPTTITIGDIHMHGVQNVADFGAELQKHLPGLSIQFRGKI